MMSNTQILCFILGWQGGTVHQVSEAIKVPVNEITDATEEQMQQLCREAQSVRIAEMQAVLLPVTEDLADHYCIAEREENLYDTWCPTFDEAVEAGKDAYDGRTFYVGKARAVTVERLFPDVDHFIEEMEEAAWDIVGEAAENGLQNKKPEILAAVRKECVDAFVRHGVIPTFWEVIESTLIKGEQEDAAISSEVAAQSEAAGN